MPRLTAVDPANATGDAKTLLDTVQKKMGRAPNILRTMANAPAALKAYLAFKEALASSQYFNAKEREAIALALAVASGCEYCAYAHTAVSKGLKVDDDEIDRRLAGHSSDPKLEAVLVFARQVVEKRGFVDDADIAAVRAAGFDDGAIAEIVANVVLNLYTHYFNHIAETAIDFPQIPLPSKAA